MSWDKLPESLAQALLPFQREGIQFAMEKEGRCLIADEMGLGKTIQAISVAYMYRDEWPLLVIVPSSLKFSWIEEFEKWLPNILPEEINLIRSGSDASGIANSPISIITYGLLRIPSAKLVKEAINRCNFKVVICDESHYLKNSKTLSSKTIVPIIKKAKRRILLSGTPALARPVELYPQLDAVCPGRFGTFWQFAERYCDPRFVYYGQQRQRKVDGACNLEELQQRMASMLMIRREKAVVLKELPAKQRQRVLFELKDSALKKEITEKFDNLRRNIHKGSKTFQQLAEQVVDVPNREQEGETDNMSVFKDISSLYRMSGEAKIGPVREYIEMLCENEDLKFLVFAYHHAMMDGVGQSLFAKKIKFVRIDGHTNGAERQANVTQFQSDPSTRVAILSILAAGVGLTLTAAKLVVFAELYWTPGVMVQCEDRAHRIGQSGGLSVHYLVAKNTMDEWVWASVCTKTYVTSAALSGKCQALQHEEGEERQIEVLSNAEAWKPSEETEDVNISQLVKSQRPPDQPSILDFISSPRHPLASQMDRTPLSDSTENTNDKQGRSCVRKSIFGSHLTKQRIPRFASPATKMKTANENLSECLVVLDSDEEEEFKPSKKKRKMTSIVVKPKPVVHIDRCGKETWPCIPNCNDKCEEVLKPCKSNCEDKCEEVSKPIKSNCDEAKSVDIFSGEDDLFSEQDSDSDSSLPDIDFLPKFNKSSDSKSNNSDLILEGAAQKNLNPVLEKEGVENCDTCMELGREAASENNNDKSVTCSIDSDKKRKDKSRQGTPEQLIEIEAMPQGNVSDCRSLSPNFSVELEQDQHFSSADHSCSTDPLDRKERREKTTNTDQWPCPICTFLNHKDIVTCEICDTPSKKTRQIKEAARTSCSSIISSPLSSNISSPKFSEEEGKGDTNKNEPGDSYPSQDESSSKRFLHLESAISSSNDIIDREPKCDTNSCDSFDDLDDTDSYLLENLPLLDDYLTEKSTPADVSQKYSKTLSFPSSSSLMSSSSTVSISTTSTTTTNNPSHNDAVCYKSLKFSCSANTGRIYVYDQDGQSLKVNFQPVEIEMGNTDGLAAILKHPQHLRLLQRFVLEWMGLSATKRRLIAKRGLIFEKPLQAYESIRFVQGSTQRHTSIKDSLVTASERAQAINGHVRLIHRRQEGQKGEGKDGDNLESGRGTAQVVTSDGVPLCLQCHKPYANPLLPSHVISKPVNAWQLRLCSHSCMDKYWTLKHASYCREQIYEIERGICKLCGLDAQGFYVQMKSIKDVRKRAELVRSSPYANLGSKAREKLLTQVMQGQFWHVDHIIPVWKGGGLCDLDNLRTLCTPCHMKVTKQQASQRANARKLSSAASGGDITAFFKKS